jgi:hypothetical protein
VAARSELEAFLHAPDLDTLATTFEALGPVTDADQAAVAAELNEWRNPRVVANALFHPSVMPRDQTMRYLLAGFQDLHPYLPLAAAVGLRELGPTFFLDWHRAQFVDVLVEALGGPAVDLRRQASISLVQMINEDEIGKIEPWLNDEDPMVRHNVMVAHVTALGPERAAIAFRRVLDERRLSDASVAALRAAADEAAALDGPADEKLWSGSLGAPTLSYIPDFDEMDSEPPRS